MTADPFAPGITLPNLIGVIPAWVDNAACGPRNPESPPLDTHYPIHNGRPGDNPDPITAVAKLVCRRCDVRELCLAWAIDNDERHGVFGGLTPTERQKLKRPRTQVIRGVCRRCNRPADAPRSEFCGPECRLANKREYDRERTAKVRAEAKEAS